MLQKTYLGRARPRQRYPATCLLHIGALLVAMLMSSLWGTVAGAQSPANRSLNLWPLFYYEGNDKSGAKVEEILWPFISFESGPKGYGYALRPLFNVRREKKNRLHEVQFLWPIGWYKSTPEKKRLRIFPLYYYDKDTPGGRREGKRRGDLGRPAAEKSSYKLFPILFGGHSQDEGSYFALFPLGGQLNHWLGRDRIHFFLFPLYADSTKGDYRSWYVLWPVFSFARGKGAGAYRFWPLFGHGYKTGEYSKDFILWPIFNFQRTGLDGDNPSEVLMLFPFYAYQRSPWRRTEAVLWPFFTYTDNKLAEYKEWQFPWPIFSLTRGKGIRKNTFWPLWGYERKGSFESLYAFWPLYWSQKETSGSFEKKQKIVLPFYWHESKTWKKEHKSAAYTRLWPLLSYVREKDGRLQLSLLSPLWFRGGEGFRRNYSPFWTLYQYESDGKGNSRSRFLWRLYRHERTKSSNSLEIIHLLSYQREGTKKVSLSLLKGLFEYQRNKSKKTLRLLYFLKLPLRADVRLQPKRNPD